MKLLVPDMSCGHCTAAIEKAVKAADPNATIATDLDSREVTLTAALDAQATQSVLAEAGYPSTLIE